MANSPHGHSDDSASDDGESELWGQGQATGDEDDVEEDLHRKEQELQAELNIATKRCQELKETLQNTKSFIDGRAPLKQQLEGTKLQAMNSDEDDDEDAYEYDEELEEASS